MTLGWWIAGAAGVVWIGTLLLRRSADLPPGDDDATLVQLAASGQRIEAIRRYRARHGGGLKEAKEAVARLARGERAEIPAPPVQTPVSDEVKALVRAGRQMDASKAYREAHPEADLATAKAAVDRLRETL